MYVTKNKGKRPIEFDRIFTGKVFTTENSDTVFLKVKYDTADLAVDLETGKVINPYGDKSSFKTCYLFPGATVNLDGNGRKADTAEHDA